MNTKFHRMINNKEFAMNNRQDFVAKFVVAVTSKKSNRDVVGGYQVKTVKGGYTILFNGVANYGAMDAQTLYGWMVRLPLNYFLMEAENIRTSLCG